MHSATVLLTRLYHLHPLSWCVALLVSLTTVLVTVPGVELWEIQSGLGDWRDELDRIESDAYEAGNCQLTSTPSSNGATANVNVYIHGWPFPYLGRAVLSYRGTKNNNLPAATTPWLRGTRKGRYWKYSGDWYMSWSNPDNWPLRLDFATTNYANLILDALIALAIVIGSLVATERWVRRRGGLWRFRLIDGVALVAMVCGVCAWYGYHARLHQRETNGVTGLRYTDVYLNGPPYMEFSRAYVGPQWLLRLVGSSKLLDTFYHIRAASIGPAADVPATLEPLRQLDYLQHVVFKGELTFDALKVLEECSPHCTMRFQQMTNHGEITTAGDGTRVVGPKDLKQLTSLRLTEIWLSGEAILAEDLTDVSAIPCLAKVTLKDVSLTVAELEALQEMHPNVTFVARWNKKKTPPQSHAALVEAQKAERANATPP